MKLGKINYPYSIPKYKVLRFGQYGAATNSLKATIVGLVEVITWIILGTADGVNEKLGVQYVMVPSLLY